MPSGTAVVRYAGKRGVVWRIKFTDASGRQVMETVGAERDGVTRKRAEAELWERLVRVDRQAFVKPTSFAFSDWSARWFTEGQRKRGWKPLTIDKYEGVLRHLDDHFGRTRIDAIRPRDVSGYIDAKLDDGFAAKTINLHVNVLHNLFKVAVAEELVTSNPVAGVERPKVIRPRWRILEPREVPAVRRAFTDDRARLAFLTFMLTGLRRSELMSLRWRDVSMAEGTLRVVETRSEEGERLLALPRSLVDALVVHYAAGAYKADRDYVFGHPTRGTPMDPDWFRLQLRAALDAVGITDRVRVHDLRHAALTNLAATGASPIAVMATAGHRSMATTRQYLHLAGVVFRADASALEARLLGVESSTDLSESHPLSADKTPLCKPKTWRSDPVSGKRWL